jgi:hypothetical protein
MAPPSSVRSLHWRQPPIAINSGAARIPVRTVTICRRDILV